MQPVLANCPGLRHISAIRTGKLAGIGRGRAHYVDPSPRHDAPMPADSSVPRCSVCGGTNSFDV